MKRSASRSANRCRICEQSEPPPKDILSAKKVLPRRSVKSNISSEEKDVLWIQCNICRIWHHVDCCGLILRDYKKLTKDTQFFKCIICCLKAVPAECYSNLLQQVSEARGNTPSNAGSAGANAVQPVGLKSFLQEDSEKKTVEENSSGRHSTAVASVECKESVLAQGMNSLKFSVDRISAPTCKEQECTATKLSFDVDRHNCTPNTFSIINGKSKPNTASADDISVIVPDNGERDNIIIVDHIPNAAEFVNSSRILKEVKLFSSDANVKYAYSLAKGGIAIHLHSQQDKEQLLHRFTKESFGGGKVYDLRARQQTLFVKSVATSVTTEQLREAFIAKGIEVHDLVRLTQNKTGRPLPVVKVICPVETAKKLLNSVFITVNGIDCRIEKKRVEVQRCYNATTTVT